MFYTTQKPIEISTASLQQSLIFCIRLDFVCSFLGGQQTIDPPDKLNISDEAVKGFV